MKPKEEHKNRTPSDIMNERFNKRILQGLPNTDILDWNKRKVGHCPQIAPDCSQ